MANGYFERGEVYWVRMDSGFGFEQGVGRPGVILSCDTQNNATETVTIAFCSKQPQKSWGVEIEATGCTSYVIGNQIATVDKSRLGKCIGVLNKAEMGEVEKLLEDYFDLGYVDDTAVKEKETEIAARDTQIKELKEEITKLKSEIAARDDAETAEKVEIAMWQRLYEKALDQVCSMKLTGDITRRVERKAPVVVGAPKEPGTPVVEDEPKLVDINTAKFDELKRLGMSNNIALAVIDKRPYKSVEDLKKVPGFTSIMYGIMSKKVCCVVQPKKIVSALVEPDAGHEAEEPASEKVNVNTVKTASEIKRRTGMDMKAACEIINHRKSVGRYEKIEDLLALKKFGETSMKRYGHLLEV